MPQVPSKTFHKRKDIKLDGQANKSCAQGLETLPLLRFACCFL